jgi:hypothetical protein
VSWIAIHAKPIFLKILSNSAILVAANKRLTDMLGRETDLKQPDSV